MCNRTLYFFSALDILRHNALIKIQNSTASKLELELQDLNNLSKSEEVKFWRGFTLNFSVRGLEPAQMPKAKKLLLYPPLCCTSRGLKEYPFFQHFIIHATTLRLKYKIAGPAA
jgi:hypothetical protein